MRMLLFFVLFACSAPYGKPNFDYKNLTKDMLSETIWCGNMSTKVYDDPKKDIYLAAYFYEDKAGIGRGRTPEEAAGMAVYRLINNKPVYKIVGSSVIISDYFDDGYRLGRISSKVSFTNNKEAIITIFASNVDSDIVYETKKAIQIDGYAD